MLLVYFQAFLSSTVFKLLLLFSELLPLFKHFCPVGFLGRRIIHILNQVSFDADSQRIV